MHDTAAAPLPDQNEELLASTASGNCMIQLVIYYQQPAMQTALVPNAQLSVLTASYGLVTTASASQKLLSQLQLLLTNFKPFRLTFRFCE